jgi:hypothetical protein
VHGSQALHAAGVALGKDLGTSFLPKGEARTIARKDDTCGLLLDVRRASGFRSQAAKNQREGQVAQDQRFACLPFTSEKADERETGERGVATDQDQRVSRGKGEASLLALQAD